MSLGPQPEDLQGWGHLQAHSLTPLVLGSVATGWLSQAAYPVVWAPCSVWLCCLQCPSLGLKELTLAAVSGQAVAVACPVKARERGAHLP